MRVSSIGVCITTAAAVTVALAVAAFGQGEWGPQIRKAMRDVMPAATDCGIDARGFGTCTYKTPQAEYEIGHGKSDVRAALSFTSATPEINALYKSLVAFATRLGFNETQVEGCINNARRATRTEIRNNYYIVECAYLEEQRGKGFAGAYESIVVNGRFTRL
jgi:hypothetical protein